MSTLSDIRDHIVSSTRFRPTSHLTPNHPEEVLLANFNFEDDNRIIDLWVTDADIDEDGDVNTVSIEIWEVETLFVRAVIGHGGFGADYLPERVATLIEQWLEEYLQDN